MMKASELPVGTTIDEVCPEFKILAVPYGVVVQLAMMLEEEYEDATVPGIIEDGIVEWNRYVEREKAEKEAAGS